VSGQSSPAITPDGRAILEYDGALTGNAVRLLNPSTGAVVTTLPIGVTTSNAIATDGLYMYTWNGSTRVVYVWNLQTGAAVANFTLPAFVEGGSGYQYSLSFANGMLWGAGTAGVPTTWHGFRLDAN
jgi:hypothetical protein